MLSTSIELLLSDFLRFYGTTAIMSVPLLVFSYGYSFLWRYAAFGSLYSLTGNWMALQLGSYVGHLALEVIGEAIVLAGAIETLRGRRLGVGAMLGRGLARIVPILGLILVIGLALMGVAAVVLVPVMFGLRSLLGVMLAVPLVAILVLAILTRWFVALPACVIERLGPLRSIGRSSNLTAGCRWRVFGIYLLILVVGTILQRVLQVVFFALIFSNGYGSAVGPYWYASSAGFFLWQALVTAFETIIVAVAYFDLRIAKEGIDVERVAAVFE